MHDSTDRIAAWWRKGSIYHIYPRSFLDSNNDGIGDLGGIRNALPYLEDLGIDAIWMGPIFTSPQVDNGYDISDYRTVDPLFGSNTDLDRLIEDAHKRGIRVLLDLVFNHSSNRHPWFEASRRRKQGYEDFYIWQDTPVNDWRGFFSLPAWTFDPVRKQYYLHLFAAEQPDLNWDNPAVRSALADVANYWIDRGIDGFRLDVINVISKQEGLPSLNGRSPSGVYIDGPNVLRYLQEFRSRLHRGDGIVLVGETPGITPEAAAAYTLPANRALDMVLLFDHLSLDHGPGGKWDPRQFDVDDLRQTITRWQHAIASPRQPSLYMSNHDQPRIVSRYGNDETYRYESATALAMLFFLLRGTPIIYQGDEIGIRNFPLATADDMVDIESTNAYRSLIESGVDPIRVFDRVRKMARDNGRTPMQWSDRKHAGFTDAAVPWFPVNPDYVEWNVKKQKESDRSVLRFYRKLLKVRKDLTVLTAGSWQLVGPGSQIGRDTPDSTIVYRREHGGTAITVAANLSGGNVKVAVKVGTYPDTSSNTAPPEVLLANLPDPPLPDENGEVVLRPWEAVAWIEDGGERPGEYPAAVSSRPAV